ncbi:Tryptophan synthase alpha chain [Labilithrix luteola]|uniref:Tryptophan synthase alpha chain n=1 Tax=Labilithrix luteola TaxID=1391654 RepID=A0A0K1PV36_9BACT|nr:Tryptophan synthase alpha chain [Labilithrix luteola]
MFAAASLASACSSDAAVQPSCTGPNCANTCEAGKTACGSSCIDTATDRLNCGACGKTCGESETCTAGECTCSAGLATCDGPNGRTCANVRSDAANCGSCGHACNGDETCFGGSCVCPGASITCGGVCTDPQTNKNHCGATEGCGEGRGSAGVACRPDFYCTSGACMACASWTNDHDVATGPKPVGITTADLNGDGKVDMLVRTSVSLDVFRGNGDGTFELIQRVAGTGMNAADIGVADFDGDGKLDVAVAGPDTANPGALATLVLFGFGDGTFAPTLTSLSRPVVQNRTAYASGLATADVNNDGKVDIVVSDPFLPGYAVILNQGNRNFAPPVNVMSGSVAPMYADPVDLDGDGKLDLVIANNTALYYSDDPSKMEIFHGNGDGTFEKRQSYVSGPAGYSVAVADLDGDGRLDIVTVDWSSAQVFRGQADGTFKGGSKLYVPVGTATVIAKDLNGDKIVDLIFAGGRSKADQSTKSFEVRIGSGDGSYFPPVILPGGTGGLTVADVDGDGRQDILAVDLPNNQVKVYLGASRSECH